jgi:hypothetical protein
MFSTEAKAISAAGCTQAVKFKRAKLSELEIAALADVDISALGERREKHHRYLLNQPEMKGFLFHEGDECIGYAYVASTGHVGPLAVTRRTAMGPALRTALKIAAEGKTDQVSAFLPGACETALNIAAEYQMRITLPMVLVSDREFGDWRRYLPRNPGFM